MATRDWLGQSNILIQQRDFNFQHTPPGGLGPCHEFAQLCQHRGSTDGNAVTSFAGAKWTSTIPRYTNISKY